MDILMPQLGETVTEGTIAVWHKKVGDEVKADDILMDVETDKVATEIPAPVGGILSAIHVGEGQTVEVGTVLAVIDTGVADGKGDVKEDTGKNVKEAATEKKLAPPGQTTSPAEGGRKLQASRKGTADTQLSPAVRRLLAEHDLEPSAIPGTGRNGRIKRSDVLAYIDASAATGGKKTTDSKASASPADEHYIPFNLQRKVTAEHMVRSKATSPHVLQAIEVDFSRVAAARQQHGGVWKQKYGYSLTWLPFIARAVCQAIREYPHLNASVEGQGLKLHATVNLAIAVDLGRDGLLAPVIRSAENLSVAGLAERINTLAGAARAGKIKPDDLSGGTYTLSNSGTFGTLITAPIINQPQVAILSIDGVKKRPVVVTGEDGDSIAIRPVGILAQSFDHRAVDGAYSAAFLQKVQSILESTNWDADL